MGHAADPQELVQAGVRDMIRISDGRMSGTSYGACILHVAPESFVGGPLAFVQTGDEIEVDVDKRSIHLAVSATRNSRAARPPGRRRRRNIPAAMARCSPQHIGQADQGCDFDFLQGTAAMPEPEIY